MEIIARIYQAIAIILMVVGMGSVDSYSVYTILLITIGFLMLAIPCYLANRTNEKSSETDYQSEITTLNKAI